MNNGSAKKYSPLVEVEKVGHAEAEIVKSIHGQCIEDMSLKSGSDASRLFSISQFSKKIFFVVSRIGPSGSCVFNLVYIFA